MTRRVLSSDGGLAYELSRRATKSAILRLCWSVRDSTDTCLEDRLLAASLADPMKPPPSN